MGANGVRGKNWIRYPLVKYTPGLALLKSKRGDRDQLEWLYKDISFLHLSLKKSKKIAPPDSPLVAWFLSKLPVILQTADTSIMKPNKDDMTAPAISGALGIFFQGCADEVNPGGRLPSVSLTRITLERGCT